MNNNFLDAYKKGEVKEFFLGIGDYYIAPDEFSGEGHNFCRAFDIMSNPDFREFISEENLMEVLSTTLLDILGETSSPAVFSSVLSVYPWVNGLFSDRFSHSYYPSDCFVEAIKENYNKNKYAYNNSDCIDGICKNINYINLKLRPGIFTELLKEILPNISDYLKCGIKLKL
jgi:hypothetical protein